MSNTTTNKKDLLVAFAEYTPLQTLALAIKVYDENGFVRSGESYSVYDDEGVYVKTISDSKTQLTELMVNQTQPTEELLAQADVIMKKFNSKFMMKKMSTGLNDFESHVATAFNAGNSLTKFQIAIIASIPNMNSIDKVRQKVEDRLETLQFKSEHFGEVRTRYDIQVEVVDCKFIQNSGVYIITCVHNDQDIVKFWWRDQPDINNIINGKTIRMRGTVNKHEIGRFSNAKETMFNRVKIVKV